MIHLYHLSDKRPEVDKIDVLIQPAAGCTHQILITCAENTSKG